MLVEIHGTCAYDNLTCEPTDAGYALTVLSRQTTIDEFGWQEGRVWWTVSVPKREREAASLQIRRVVEKAISLHSASF